MLSQLSIRNIVLIDRLDLEFQPGLNVLTGETGAGKSILLDALGFALGARTRGEVLREGAEEGSVTAVFDVADAHPARAVLAGLDLPDEPGEPIILRRAVTQEGRRTAFVNDRRASTEALRQLGEAMLEIHGQQDDRGLLDPKVHRALLDAYAGHDAEAVRAAWSTRRAAEQALTEAREAQANAARDEEYIRHAVDELQKLDPQPGEEDALDLARRQMQAAGRLREGVERAAQALGGDGAEAQMGDATRWLEDTLAQADGALDDPLEETIAALGRAFAELAEAQSGIEAALDKLVNDPHALEETEERLFALRALARKHQVLPDALPDLASELTSKLEAIDGGDARIAALEEEAKAADAAYAKAAATLSKARHTAAKRLDKAIAAELPPLRMEAARFATEVAPAEPGPSGTDAVTFTVSTNPGTPAGPINRIASGGELSRFLLALKVCLTTRAEGLTMIFDEIDRGVGGATADAVGRRLARLAGDAQVLVVTHSPQVAAQGGHQWRISKASAKGSTRTTVTPLAAEERIDEIARMLAGDRLTPEARAAATALLEG